MTLTRVYLPLDVAHLRDLARTRALEGAPLVAYAVTEALRGAQPGGDEEDWEYAALQAAAEDCAERGRRRIVAAADVDPTWLQEAPGGADAALVVTEPVPLQRIASFHVGDEQAADDEELSWYDATELTVLLDLVAP